MPRIRTIKPSFFQSDDVAALPMRARLTWIGLWTHCDDQGRAKDHARLIKAAIWPLDNVSLADIEDDLTTLFEQGRIVRYETAGQRYLAIVNWHAHQTINRPSKSTIPAPPDPLPTPSVRTHEPLTEDSYGEGKGKEGKGREGTRAREDEPPTPNTTGPEPLSRCAKHEEIDDPPPCHACGVARRAHEAWTQDREAAARRADQAHRQAEAHARAEANRIAIAACHDCDERGYLGGRPCPHDPNLSNRARAGAEAARAALNRRPA